MKQEFGGLRAFGVEQVVDDRHIIYDFAAPGTTNGTDDGFVTIRGENVNLPFFLNLVRLLGENAALLEDPVTAKEVMQRIVSSGWRAATAHETPPQSAGKAPSVPVQGGQATPPHAPPTPPAAAPPTQPALPLPAAPPYPADVMSAVRLDPLVEFARRQWNAESQTQVFTALQAMAAKAPSIPYFRNRSAAQVEAEVSAFMAPAKPTEDKVVAAPAKPAKPADPSPSENKAAAASVAYDSFPPDDMPDGSLDECVGWLVEKYGDRDDATDVIVKQMQMWGDLDLPILNTRDPKEIRQGVFESLVSQEIISYDDLPDDLKEPDNTTPDGVLDPVKIIENAAKSAGTTREIVEALVNSGAIARNEEAIARAFDEAIAKGVTFAFPTTGLLPRIRLALKNLN